MKNVMKFLKYVFPYLHQTELSSDSVVNNVNITPFYIQDSYYNENEKWFSILFYNDEDNSNSKDLYERLWSNITATQYFKNHQEMTIRVELTDRSGSHVIRAHEPVVISNSYDFEDYWSLVKDTSTYLDDFYKDVNNNISYSRLYVYFY